MKVRDVMQRSVTTIDEADSLGLALQLMLWRDLRHLPVLRQGRLVGLLSERDILTTQARGELGLSNPARDAMQPAEHIHPDADVADAAADLATRRSGCLPVVSAGELIGVLTPTDLLGILGQQPVSEGWVVPHSLCAADVMRPRPMTVHPDDTLLDAAARMSTGDVRHLCVVDGEQRLIGMLSDRDVRSAVGNPLTALSEQAPGPRIAELRVAHAMTADPQTVAPETSIADVINVLVRERIGALPVITDDGRVDGIVSYVDVLRATAAGALS